MAVLEALAAFGNEPQLVEDETAHGGVSRALRQSNVVLHVEIAHIQCGVEDQSAVRKSKRLLDNVKFVVNLSHHLLKDVFDGDYAQQAAECVHDEGHAWWTGAQ